MGRDAAPTEGTRFGRWTVIGPTVSTTTPKNKKLRRLCECQCDCGTRRLVTLYTLFKDGSTSCGCASEKAPIDLVGARFGALTVAAPASSRVQPSGKIRRRWTCRCDCGNTSVVTTQDLRSGHTTTCGCSRVTMEREERARNTILSSYRNQAKVRGLPFDLTAEQVAHLVSLSCAYCTLPPANVLVGRPLTSVKLTPDSYVFKYSGIDRVDSDAGYAPGNVLPCCKVCNQAKNDLPLREFLIAAARVHLGTLGIDLVAVQRREESLLAQAVLLRDDLLALTRPLSSAPAA